MKKHTSHKQHRHTQTTPVKRSFVAKSIRFVLFGILLVGLFFSSMYGFRCLVTKVCDVIVIDKFVRHDVTILMPKGALEVEMVDTPASRELGLSGRTTMGDDEGMLFVFDDPGRYGFWMKDMKFPLDIIWINQNGVIVSIERELTPESYPKAFTNQADASYVLEIKSGMSERFGLYLGSKIKIVE